MVRCGAVCFYETQFEGCGMPQLGYGYVYPFFVVSGCCLQPLTQTPQPVMVRCGALLFHETQSNALGRFFASFSPRSVTSNRRNCWSPRSPIHPAFTHV